MYSKVIQLYIDMYFFRFSIINYYKILNIVPGDIQKIFVVYFVISTVYMLILNS